MSRVLPRAKGDEAVIACLRTRSYCEQTKLTPSTESIWNRPPAIADAANEATVEIQFIAPLLDALGYGSDDIAAKHPVRIQDGHAVTSKYADFVIFDGPSRDEGDALLVIEAKRPGEPMEPARRQAESYALRLRALVYVVADGRSLEVWQYRRTGKSELVVSCRVSDLPAHRAEIEANLDRESLKAYRAQIREPNLRGVAWDLSAYENAELARLAAGEVRVNRTLLRTEFPSADSKPISADDEYMTCGPLTLIFASSGMGKSSLCSLLYQQALTRRRLLRESPLPVALSLPEASASVGDISQFAYNRIAAHCPQFTLSMFGEILRTRGLDLYCDAFDRVPDMQRAYFGDGDQAFRRT